MEARKKNKERKYWERLVKDGKRKRAKGKRKTRIES
jgi:hypothetical protein